MFLLFYMCINILRLYVTFSDIQLQYKKNKSTQRDVSDKISLKHIYTLIHKHNTNA